MVNEFTKVAGYEINIQKLVAFLYTNNELSDREIKKSHLHLHPKNRKYLGINKVVKDLYSENYWSKTLKKEIREDINK